MQANFTVDEFVECDRLLRSHPDVIAALAKRGITDIDLVFMRHLDLRRCRRAA